MAHDLPDGVTGREDVFGPRYIAAERRACGNETAFTLYARETVALLSHVAATLRPADLTPGATITPEAQHLLRLLVGAVRDPSLRAEAPDVECPWEGDVEVNYYSSLACWTCPLCECLHDEEQDE